MSLTDKIENLQNKPERYRRKIFAASLILIMSAVLFVWVTTLRFSLSGQENKNKNVCDPVAVLCGIGKDGYNVLTAGVKNSFGRVKKIYEGYGQ